MHNTDANKTLTPMLEALLRKDTAPPVAPHPQQLVTLEEANKQLGDLMQRRAVAMDVLAKL